MRLSLPQATNRFLVSVLDSPQSARRSPPGNWVRGRVASVIQHKASGGHLVGPQIGGGSGGLAPFDGSAKFLYNSKWHQGSATGATRASVLPWATSERGGCSSIGQSIGLWIQRLRVRLPSSTLKCRLGGLRYTEGPRGTMSNEHSTHLARRCRCDLSIRAGRPGPRPDPGSG